jgi:hypothetical protein
MHHTYSHPPNHFVLYILYHKLRKCQYIIVHVFKLFTINLRPLVTNFPFVYQTFVLCQHF